MPSYVVVTEETVAGRYEVEADSADAARAKFEVPGIDWEGVEQVSYMAFAVGVREVRDA